MYILRLDTIVYAYHMEKVEKNGHACLCAHAKSQKAVSDLQDLSEVQSRAHNGDNMCGMERWC